MNPVDSLIVSNNDLPPLENAQAGPPPYSNEMFSKVKAAYDSGLFESYKSALKKQSDGSWERDDWSTRISELVSGIPPENQKVDLINAYLFVTAIDPNIDETTKKTIIANTVQPLPTDELVRFNYSLGRSLPPLMSSTILRYCDKNIWQDVCTYILKFRNISIHEKSFYSWFLEVSKNNWGPEAKKAFLDQIIDTLPPKDAKDVIAYFQNRVSHDEETFLLNSCSEHFTQQYFEVKTEVLDFGQTTFKQLQETPKAMRIPFQGNQRTSFIKWFHKNELTNNNASLIAVDFDKEDWQDLFKCEGYDLFWEEDPFRRWGMEPPKKLIELCMQWMVDISYRLGIKQIGQNNAPDRDPTLWLFFQKASLCIKKTDSWNLIPDSSYLQLANNLSPSDLCRYIDAFEYGHEKTLNKKIIENIFTHFPQKFIDWVTAIINIPEGYSWKTSEKIQDLLQRVSDCKFPENKPVQLFSQSNSDPTVTLTLYSAALPEHQKEILKHILNNQEGGINLLVKWTDLCVNSRDKLKPFVVDAFSKDLFKHLKEIDPNLPQTLKNAASAENMASGQSQEFIDSLLPVDIDWNDPIVCQQEAIKKLKKQFLTPYVSHGDRRNFVRSIYHQLKGSRSSEEMINDLFQTMPIQTWPLLFFYFSGDLCEREYFTYAEEKSHGGMFRTVVENDQPTIKPEELEEWLERVVITMVNTVDNPLVSDDVAGWSLQAIYQATCETKTIYKVVDKLIERVPSVQFLAIMDQFHQSAFYYNKEGFNSLLAYTMQSNGKNKIEYIAKCIIEEHNNEKKSSHWLLVSNLSGKPFVNSSEEKAALVKQLLSVMGPHFLGLHCSGTIFVGDLLKSLQEVDRKCFEDLFYMGFEFLVQCNNSTTDKFNIFQNMCEDFAYAGFNIMEPLKAGRLARAADWYRIMTEGLEENIKFSKVSLNILYQFDKDLNHNGFYHTLFRKIKSVISSDERWYMSDLNKIFSELEPEWKQTMFNWISGCDLFGHPREEAGKIKEKCLGDLMDAFKTFKSKHIIPLICEIIPDWKERLCTLAIAEIKKAKENAMTYGAQPDWYEIIGLYESLAETNLLNEWLNMLHYNGDDDVKASLVDIWKKYETEREKNNIISQL